MDKDHDTDEEMSYDYNALVSTFETARKDAADSAADAAAAIAARGSGANSPNSDERNANMKQSCYLQEAVKTAENLAQNCPMTPLLWMQYSRIVYDHSYLSNKSMEPTKRAVVAQQLQLQTLQLGILEFPGSALLHFYTVWVALQNISDNKYEQVKSILQVAIENVGQGSHSNSSKEFVAPLYNILAQVLLLSPDSDSNELAISLFQHRSTIPMKDANFTLMEEYKQIFGSDPKPDVALAMENGRKQEAKWYTKFASYEDDVSSAMNKEGILSQTQPEFKVVDSDEGGRLLKYFNHVDWDLVMNPNTAPKKYGMGFGSIETAKAFIQYAKALRNYHLPDDKDYQDPYKKEMENKIHKLTLAVYERGVAECPTIEAIWLAYIQDLHYWIENGSSTDNTGSENELAEMAGSRIHQVCYRAVRNCPYSVALLQQKLLAVLLTNLKTVVVVDPEQLIATVKQGLAAEFLPVAPTSAFNLYMTATRVVKRRILTLLANRVKTKGLENSGKKNKQKNSKKDELVILPYDAPETFPYNVANHKLIIENYEKDIDALQEVQDLTEDLSDMYDAIEVHIKEISPDWKEGIAWLWKERAQTEALMLIPLRRAFVKDNEPSSEATKNTKGDDGSAALEAFDKSIKAVNPPHPDLHMMYIREYMALFSGFTPENPEEILVRLRRIRSLFEKAVRNVGKGKGNPDPVTLPSRDYELALAYLCDEWLEFERMFGSESSLARATIATIKKRKKALETRNQQEFQQQDFQPTTPAVVDEDRKRKTTSSKENGDHQNVSKKAKTEDDEVNDDEAMDVSASPDHDEADTAHDETVSKHPVHKVTVGKLEYPAHPYTVKVSNLSPDTEDMDLVDTFRPKCGAVVHARILREKHHGSGKGKSKGWGLIQFEESTSVETALALNDVIGINEKIVKVERSHMPAVQLVPPGMHRVNPKGGKGSNKRNQQQKHGGKNADEDGEEHNEDEAKKNSTVLSLRPRRLASGNQKKKTDLS